MIFVLLGADIVMALIFLLHYSSLPPQIPLFYSLPWGEEQLADSWFILLLPAIMHVSVGANMWLYQKYFFPEHFMKKVTDSANWIIIIVTTLVFARIILLIT